MIGDAWSDVQAGQSAGVRQAILLKTGRGKSQLSQLLPHISNYLIFDNLPQAFEEIVTTNNAQETVTKS